MPESIKWFFEFLLSIGLTAGVVSAAVVWLSKQWLSQKIKSQIESAYARQLESFKTEIKNEYDQKLETHKAQLKAQGDIAIENLRANLTLLRHSGKRDFQTCTGDALKLSLNSTAHLRKRSPRSRITQKYLNQQAAHHARNGKR